MYCEEENVIPICVFIEDQGVGGSEVFIQILFNVCIRI